MEENSNRALSMMGYLLAVLGCFIWVMAMLGLFGVMALPLNPLVWFLVAVVFFLLSLGAFGQMRIRSNQ